MVGKTVPASDFKLSKVGVREAAIAGALKKVVAVNAIAQEICLFIHAILI